MLPLFHPPLASAPAARGSAARPGAAGPWLPPACETPAPCRAPHAGCTGLQGREAWASRVQLNLDARARPGKQVAAEPGPCCQRQAVHWPAQRVPGASTAAPPTRLLRAPLHLPHFRSQPVKGPAGVLAAAGGEPQPRPPGAPPAQLLRRGRLIQAHQALGRRDGCVHRSHDGVGPQSAVCLQRRQPAGIGGISGPGAGWAQARCNMSAVAQSSLWVVCTAAAPAAGGCHSGSRAAASLPPRTCQRAAWSLRWHCRLPKSCCPPRRPPA